MFILISTILISILLIYYNYYYHNKILVSALCITYKKPNYLKNAIKDFLNQSYTNKELIILYDDDDDLTQNFRDKSNYDKSVKWYKMDSKLNLGQLRNKSVEFANGEYVIQWDDDDSYHKDRIKIQLHFALKTNKAVILDDWIILNMRNKKKYSLIRQPGWEGSILSHKKHLLKYKYQENMEKGGYGEDTYCIDKLLANNLIYSLSNHAYLYTYRILHGKNTCPDDHFTGWMMNSATEIS
jgi:hypothetical protein